MVIDMRTTVTFEPDVYVKLKRLGKNQEFKPFINEVLRHGLQEIERTRTLRAKPGLELPLFEVQPLIFDLDNVHQLLEDLELHGAG